ncbi:MAG: ABC transporter ATP-binding protein [Thermoprotei archaeon]
MKKSESMVLEQLHTEHAVRVSGLKKLYGSLTAVDGISFEVSQGEVFSLLGPNGAGKTTTVEILEGLRKADGGEVLVLGLDPWRQGRELHSEIGVIPQGFRFFDKSTPVEAVEYYAKLFGRKIEPEGILEMVELSDASNIYYEDLSGGQKQKVGLALALVNDPKILFLDEPTTGLDPYARRAVWEVIRNLRSRGKTVFLTTHYLEEAETLADRVAIMNKGKIVAMGTPSELISKFGSGQRLTIRASEDVAASLRAMSGLDVQSSNGLIEVKLRDWDDVFKVVSSIRASNIQFEELDIKKDSLEDVFIRLVGKMREGEIS